MNIVGTEIVNGKIIDSVHTVQMTERLWLDTLPPPEREVELAVVDPANAHECNVDVPPFNGYAVVRALADRSAAAAKQARLASLVL